MTLTQVPTSPSARERSFRGSRRESVMAALKAGQQSSRAIADAAETGPTFSEDGPPKSIKMFRGHLAAIF